MIQKWSYWFMKFHLHLPMIICYPSNLWDRHWLVLFNVVNVHWFKYVIWNDVFFCEPVSVLKIDISIMKGQSSVAFFVTNFSVYLCHSSYKWSFSFFTLVFWNAMQTFCPKAFQKMMLLWTPVSSFFPSAGHIPFACNLPHLQQLNNMESDFIYNISAFFGCAIFIYFFFIFTLWTSDTAASFCILWICFSDYASALQIDNAFL